VFVVSEVGRYGHGDYLVWEIKCSLIL